MSSDKAPGHGSLVSLDAVAVDWSRLALVCFGGTLGQGYVD